jgi:hypothetical protein
VLMVTLAVVTLLKSINLGSIPIRRTFFFVIPDYPIEFLS